VAAEKRNPQRPSKGKNDPGSGINRKKKDSRKKDIPWEKNSELSKIRNMLFRGETK